MSACYDRGVIATGAVTTTGTSTLTFNAPRNISAMGVVFDLTAAASETGDKLDAYVQTTLDGTNWVDVIHFTQCAGDGGAKRYFAKVGAPTAETMFENAAALGAAAVRNFLGEVWRTRHVITDVATTSNCSFTYTITLSPM